jgi:ankyrin repeat protein
MIDCGDLSILESLIRWGVVDASRQRRFEEYINNQLELVKCSDRFGTTLLMLAAGAGNFEATQFLCALGADANALSHAGETPLISLVREAEIEQSGEEILARIRIIDCLALHGANPNLLGYQGCSALHWSIIYGQVKFVDQLLRVGARPEIRLNDPPDHQTASELVNSTRCRGTNTQKKLIAELLESGLP